MNASTRRSRAHRGIHLALTLALLGCSGPVGESEEVATLELGVNACNEEVPSDRFIDGFPAYAQCDGVSSGSIYSNNGIDTSTTSLGDDWIQTQRGGGYQCTEWTYRYMRFRWGIHYRSGDAQEWCDGELPDTLVKSTVPVHGDLMIFAGGVCGADESTGHIVVIDTVDDGAGRVTFVEQNRAGRRSANQSCATCFLHAVANDGTSGGAGGMGASGAGGMGTSGAGSGGTGTSGSGGVGTSGASGDTGSGGVPAAAGAAGSGGVSGAFGGGGAGTNGDAGAAQTGGTAGSTMVGVGGSAGAGAAGGPPTAGGSGGSQPSAGGPPTPTAGTAGSGETPGQRASSATEPPPDAGCSITRPARSSNDALYFVIATLLAGAMARRRR